MKVKKKRIDSDKLLQRKSTGVRKPNPFETVVNRSKHAVLNRDPQSTRPGALRKRAFETRKQTLGKEFAMLNKTNQFVDARGKRVKQPQQPSNASQRKEMYNLNLTHRGQTLAELENLDDGVDDDNDDDDEDGRLHEDFTKATHFGGGSDDEEAANGRDRKTVIEEMIAESKRLKAEKQRDNDLVFEKSQALDKDLKLLMSHVGSHMRKENERPELDDYDRTMREMIFERRGAPAEKLKSEELARKEVLRKERLEKERLERMKHETNEQGSDKGKKHLSADALDDGYVLDDDEEQLGEENEYTNGENGYDPRKVSEEAAGKSSDDSDDDDEEGEEEESGSDVDSLSDLKNGAPESEAEEEEETEPEKEPEAKVKQKALPETEPKNDQEGTTNGKEKLKKKKEKEPESEADEGESDEDDDDDDDDDGDDEEEKKASNDKTEPPIPSVAHMSIPVYIEIPKQYEDFATLLENHTVEEQALIIGRVIQRTNENHHYARSQRSVIFVYIIQHLVDRFTVTNVKLIETDFKALHLFTPHLYDLAQKDPPTTGGMFLDILQEKHAEYQKHPQRHPPLATLILLKLLPSLFSASDARHPVVTPGMVFISELLTRCPIRNRRQIARGLFLITTVLECVEQSKRFLPAALTFLNGVINQANPSTSSEVPVKAIRPFKANVASLVIAQDDDADVPSSEILKLTAEDLMQAEMTKSFKVRAVATALSMMAAVGRQLTDCPAIQIITKGFLQHLDALDKECYPSKVRVLLKKTRRSLAQLAERPVTYMVAAEKKPKPLRLLEPLIEPVYEDVKRLHKSALPVREQRKKLIQKIRKEKRGAAREIRLDNEFIAKLQHKRRMESDRERKEKVRRIFNDATMQQGEFKSLDRRAKYRK